MINTIARVHSLGLVPSHLVGHPTWRPATPGHQPDTFIVAHAERKTVLVIDDENLIADSVAEILNRNGYDAIARYNSTAAIQTIHDERCPDIVVADVIMPGIDGIQLAKAVRSLRPDARIFLFSGNAATLSLLHQASAEGYSFNVLAKPVHPVRLLQALQT